MGNKPILSIDQRMLLDRLYNLKSVDSEIIKEIRERIETNKNDYQVLSDEASELKNQKDAIAFRKAELDSQYAKILEDLKGISRRSYEILLDEADEAFDPEAMLERLRKTIPARSQEIYGQITRIDEDIAETKKKISDNEIDSTELEGRLADALQLQEKLIKIIEESLRDNGSITRDSVQELLIGLGFTEDETIELGKMILFPQGTLTQYEEEYQEKQNRGKSIQEVFSDAIEAAPEGMDVPQQEEPAKVVAEEPVKVEEDIPEPEVTQKIEEPKEDKSDSFFKETTITEGSLSKEVVDILASADQNALIKKNIGILRTLEIKDTTINTYYAVLLDEELENKVKFFRDVLLKSARDLDLNFEILLVYTYQDLQALQKACQDYDLDLSMISLGAMRQGLANFFTNLEFLTSKGVELDRSEVTKFGASLFVEANHFQNNFEMVSKYQYGLTKKNGKTAIQVLTKDSTELATGLDAVIETGEEKVFESAPEKMSIDLIGLANRIAYCQRNGISIYNDKGSVHKFLFDVDEFAKVFEGVNPKEFEVIPTAQESAKNVREVLNNSTLLEVLATMNLETVYLSGRNIADESTYFELMTYNEAVESQAEKTEHTYVVDGVVISKEKFERNVLFLLNSGITAPNEELITAALLYGSLKDKEEMKRVATKMGFNAPVVGGVVQA